MLATGCGAPRCTSIAPDVGGRYHARALITETLFECACPETSQSSALSMSDRPTRWAADMVSDTTLLTVVMCGGAIWVALYVAELIYNHTKRK